MLSLFQKYRYRFKTKGDFLNCFFANPKHEWIASDRYLKSSFDEFFSFVPLAIINELYQKHSDIWFVKSNGRFSCTFSSEMCPVVIIFPELVKELSSFNPRGAHAVLAHELGHVFHEHSKKMIDPMQAQVEADEFAIDLGFEVEIEDFLNSRPESVEKRVRLTYLTSKVLG